MSDKRLLRHLIMLISALAVDWLIIYQFVFPLLPESVAGGMIGLGLFFFTTLFIVVGFTEHLENKGE